jgi:hypothetical protein
VTRRITVVHAGYGCDSGCCGHVLVIDGIEDRFQFLHPYGEDPRAWAEAFLRDQLGDEHVSDLDWAHCDVRDD